MSDSSLLPSGNAEEPSPPKPSGPSQRRIWLGALATAIASAIVGSVFAQTHVIVLFIVLLPLTVLFLLAWLGFAVAAIAAAIFGAVADKPWAPHVASGVVTSLLGALSGGAAALVQSAYYFSHQPAIDATGRPNDAHTFSESLFNPFAWADMTFGMIFGTVIGITLGISAMVWAREQRSGPRRVRAQSGG